MRRLLVAVLAVLLLTSACGGNPEPKPLPKPTATSSPTTSSQPPVMPDEAKAKTKDGAIAFAQAFIETVNFAGAAGETTALRALYLPACTRCEALADGIDQTYASGGNFKGGDWTPTSSKFYAIKNDVAVLDVVVDYSAQTWIKTRDAPAQSFPASQGNLKAFNLRWSQGAWRVSALDPNK